MTTEFQEGDVGTRVRVAIPDETGEYLTFDDLIDKQMIIQPPTGTSFTVDPDIELNTSDPATPDKLVWTTESGQLIPAGGWQAQAMVQKPDGRWHTKVKHFTVRGNLDGATT